jgi:hypothetical protein
VDVHIDHGPGRIEITEGAVDEDLRGGGVRFGYPSPSGPRGGSWTEGEAQGDKKADGEGRSHSPFYREWPVIGKASGWGEAFSPHRSPPFDSTAVKA